MEDSKFTTKEILKRISKEEKYISKCNDEIELLKCCITTSGKTINFWKEQLKIAEKREAKEAKGKGN